MHRTILETIPAVVLRVSLGGVIEFVNRVLPEYSGAGLVGQSIYVFAPPDQHDAMRVALERTIRTRETSSYETIAEAPDKTRDWYLTTVGPILDGAELLGLTLICINISRLKEAEEALEQSRAERSMALAAGDVGLWRWDRASDVLHWDDKLCAMFGRTRQTAPRTGADVAVALMPADQVEMQRAHAQRAVHHGGDLDSELRVDLPDGVRWLMVKGGVIRDPNGEVPPVRRRDGRHHPGDRKRLEERVHQAQKLEAVGQISAGIAHNFNNMLAVIVPTLEMAKHTPSAVALLDDALTSAKHAAQLVKQLMIFSRGRDATQGRREPLAEVVRRATVDLCCKTFERRIEWTCTGFATVEGIIVDAGDTELAIVNILLNARDALEHIGGRPARISVALRKLSREETTRRHPGQPGCSAELRITDTGVGMDEATRLRIFEPFFTTKEVGQGTGLGLSTAWAVLHAHHDLIDCESTPGVGTTFTLLLQSASAAADDTATPQTPALHSQGRVVLVIDDEPAVRRTTEALLKHLGFTVLCAASGEEGVSLGRDTHIDVVLLDYSMPGQAPQQTLLQLRAGRPTLPVICCSGLGTELVGATGTLLKPFGLDALSTMLSKVLEANVA